MNSSRSIVGKPLAWLLTLIYFTSYVTRINFAAIIQEVVTDTGYEKSALSVILVCLSVTYGFEQIINGRLGDKIKPQNLIFCGLLLATVINFIFPFCSGSIPLMAVIWGINGFAQAMMWPPIVKILVANCDDEMYGYSVVRISWGSSFGTIAVYLTAPLIIGFLGWKAVFWISAAIGLVIVAMWAVMKARISTAAPQLPDASASQRSHPSKSGFRFPKSALFPILFIALGIIFQGMLRDGVTSWMPTYLAEVFNMGNQASILCTVSLAVFSIITFSVVGSLYKKFFKNEVACGGLTFGVATLASLALFFFFDGGAVVAILMMMLITGCMHGVNLMLITHVPKRFKKYGNISTLAGVINSCTYIGSAIFTYGVALLSEKIGWHYTVGVWFLISALGTLCCFIAVKPWKKFMEQE